MRRISLVLSVAVVTFAAVLAHAAHADQRDAGPVAGSSYDTGVSPCSRRSYLDAHYAISGRYNLHAFDSEFLGCATHRSSVHH